MRPQWAQSKLPWAVRFWVPVGWKKELVNVAAEAVVTVSVELAERLSEADVPVIERVELPGGVVLDVVTTRLEFPEPVTDVGDKDDDAPPGTPFTSRFTLP